MLLELNQPENCVEYKHHQDHFIVVTYDAFLVRHGCHPGSSCIMTPTAFCTTEVWKEIALKRAKSIRNMDPVIKAHPNWFCIEILDGFAAHFNSPEALQIYYDHKQDYSSEGERRFQPGESNL
jgi:hypothetical protein